MQFVFYVELYIPFCFFYLAASLKRMVSCSGGNSVLLCICSTEETKLFCNVSSHFIVYISSLFIIISKLLRNVMQWSIGSTACTHGGFGICKCKRCSVLLWGTL